MADRQQTPEAVTVLVEHLSMAAVAAEQQRQIQTPDRELVEYLSMAAMAELVLLTAITQLLALLQAAAVVALRLATPVQVVTAKLL